MEFVDFSNVISPSRVGSMCFRINTVNTVKDNERSFAKASGYRGPPYKSGRLVIEQLTGSGVGEKKNINKQQNRWT